MSETKGSYNDYYQPFLASGVWWLNEEVFQDKITTRRIDVLKSFFSGNNKKSRSRNPSRMFFRA